MNRSGRRQPGRCLSCRNLFLLLFSYAKQNVEMKRPSFKIVEGLSVFALHPNYEGHFGGKDRSYSYLNAVTGSIRAARLAGA